MKSGTYRLARVAHALLADLRLELRPDANSDFDLFGARLLLRICCLEL
jgi:hypothetical protein